MYLGGNNEMSGFALKYFRKTCVGAIGDMGLAKWGWRRKLSDGSLY